MSAGYLDMKTPREALQQALVMLEMIARGQTFSTEEWHRRTGLMGLHLTNKQAGMVRPLAQAEIDARKVK